MRNHYIPNLLAEALAREFRDNAHENAETYTYEDIRGATIKVTVERKTQPVKIAVENMWQTISQPA